MLVTSLGLLAAAVAWISWSNIRSKLAYDLHKIRGPPAWPLLGNLDELLGSSYLHKVLNHMSGGVIETSARIHIAAVGPNSQSTCACVSFNLVANINPASKASHLNHHKRLCPCAAADPWFCNLKPRFAISGSVLSANVTCSRSDHYLHPLPASHGGIGCVCCANTGKLE